MGRGGLVAPVLGRGGLVSSVVGRGGLVAAVVGRGGLVAPVVGRGGLVAAVVVGRGGSVASVVVGGCVGVVVFGAEDVVGGAVAVVAAAVVVTMSTHRPCSHHCGQSRTHVLADMRVFTMDGWMEKELQESGKQPHRSQWTGRWMEGWRAHPATCFQ